MEQDEIPTRTIRVKIEPDSFIQALESMARTNGNSTDITFTKLGFTTYTRTVSEKEAITPKKAVASSVRETGQLTCKYYKEWLAHYDYDPSIGASYSGQIQTNDFLNGVKSTKKQTLEFLITVNKDGTSGGIVIYTGIGGEKHIQFNQQRQPIRYTDAYERYYLNTDPVAKPLNNTLKNIWSSLKQNSGTGIKLRYRYGEITSALAVIVVTPRAPEFSIDHLSSDSYIDPDDSVRDVNLPTTSLITQMFKLSPTGVAQIYMSPGADKPIVMKTNIGHQGHAILSINVR